MPYENADKPKLFANRQMTANLLFVVNELGQVRRETHGGVEYLIAPAVAIRAGVLNGVMVPADVIEVSTYAWQGVPVPLGVHPQEGDMFVSANTPELTANNPARFWNPYYEDGALKGEIWIDIERARQVGGDPWLAVQQLEAGQVLENSTGYFADEVQQTGIWNGKRYQRVVTQIFPDHLAVLLHEVGACSVADGCGVLVNASQEGDMPTECKKVTVNFELSLSDQEQLVYEAWYRFKYPEYGMHTPVEQMLQGQIIKVYQDRVDVSRLDGLYAYPYTIDESGVIAFGEPQQYQQPTANQAGFMQSIMGLVEKALSRPNKEANVKEQLIRNLLANKRNKFTEEQLKAMDEPTLKVLSEMAEEQPATPPTPAPAPTPPPAPATSETPSTPPADQPPAWVQALTAKIEAQGQQIEQLTSQLTANAAKARQPMIDFIVANSDLFTAEELAGKSEGELERLKQLVAQANHYPINYAGLGLPTITGNADQEMAKPPSLIEALQTKNGQGN